MRRWSIVPLARSLGSHAGAWDGLNRSRFGGHPLLESSFVDGLLRHFGDGSERLCMLQEDGALLALCIVRPRSRLVWTSFTPSQGQLGATMVPEPDMLASLPACLPRTVIQLDLLCNDPLVGAVLRGGAVRRQLHALTMRIALEGSFAGYLAARPRHLQSNLRRYDKRLREDGLAARFVRLQSPEQLGAAVARYAALEGAGWKGRAGTALGSRPEQLAFYRELLEQAGAGRAVAYELWLGERLAASRLALCDAHMVVMLKTSYDETLARYAPGRLLLHAAIEDGFATHPGAAIEFYTDASADQLEWATDQRWIEHVSVYRNRPADLAIHLLRAASGPRALGAPATAGTVEAFSHPDALPADARQFMARTETRNIEFGVDWYRNLVETVYSEHDAIRLYVLRQDGKVGAVLPLRAERARAGWRIHSLSNFYTTLYEPALAPGLRGADLLPLLAALRAEFPRIAALTLAPMAPESQAHQALLEALRLDRFAAFEFFAFGNWYQPVRSDWPAYLAAREGSLRSTIKRMDKKFAAAGGVLEVVTQPEDMAGAIAAYEQVYAASWKKPEPFPRFMPGLLQTCAEKGMLRLGLARLDGRAVAAQVWIVGHGRAAIYKLAYDEQFKAYAPGTLITAMLMRHVIETDRVAEIDYLMGDDPYKKSWMGERRERWGIVAYNLRTASGLAGLARELLGRATRSLRRARLAA